MMNRIFILCTLLLCGYLAGAQNITVATFNVRYDNPGDSGNLWVNRAPVVAGLIRYHDFDVMGTQEAKHHQLEDLSRLLPAYTRYGKGRDDGKTGGEHSAIYFKKDKFTLLRSGDFWLSQTPNVPGKGWDATCCNRIASWVQLQEKTSGKEFFVFNAHFDHQGKIARVESGKLMLQKIKEIAGTAPAILTGDFNGDRNSEWYKTLATSALLHDSYNDVKDPYENNASFNAFGKDLDGKEVIDHIFLTKGLKASRWAILTDTYHGKFPSDHFPVVAVVKL